nr:hypothetical protein CFP56_63455 [Quercus suber]
MSVLPPCPFHPGPRFRLLGNTLQAYFHAVSTTTRWFHCISAAPLSPADTRHDGRTLFTTKVAERAPVSHDDVGRNVHRSLGLSIAATRNLAIKVEVSPRRPRPFVDLVGITILHKE